MSTMKKPCRKRERNRRNPTVVTHGQQTFVSRPPGLLGELLLPVSPALSSALSRDRRAGGSGELLSFLHSHRHLADLGKTPSFPGLRIPKVGAWNDIIAPVVLGC